MLFLIRAVFDVHHCMRCSRSQLAGDLDELRPGQRELSHCVGKRRPGARESAADRGSLHQRIPRFSEQIVVGNLRPR